MALRDRLEPRIQKPRVQDWAMRFMNRPIDRLAADSGSELPSLHRSRHRGPGVLAQMYRGVATRA